MSELLIWGTGNIAKKMLKNGFGATVVGYIQSNKTDDTFMGKTIYSPDNINISYDYIVVANIFADEIYETCIENNLDIKRIVFFVPPVRHIEKVEINLQNIRRLLGEANYSLYCEKRGLWKDTYISEDIKKYTELNQRESFAIHMENLWPIVGDKFADAGLMGNYFWQDLWAARLIIKSGIKKQFDIGSRLDGFIAHLLAADINVTIIDVRNFPEEVENLQTIVDDATSLRQIPDESIESMSALCSLEHFGLGRYGDPIDPESCFKCFDNIQKKLLKGGNLYISVPIGKERVEFNAHRVFYASTIIESFSQLQLKEFSCTANGKIEYNIDIHKYDEDNHHGDYRYGLFYFQKPDENN